MTCIARNLKQNSARITSVILGLFTIVITAPATRAQSESGTETQARIYEANTLVSDYLELLAQGNIESARQFWIQSALDRSTRFGITYDNISIKADLNSPVMRSAKLKPKISLRGATVLDSNFLRVETVAIVGKEQITYDYYVMKHSGYHWLTFPADYYSQGWPIKTSKYFRIHVNPERNDYFNQVAVQALDDFVDTVGIMLGLEPKDLTPLSESKIDYYLCSSESEVGKLTPMSSSGARGVYDLASDAIVSSTIPHFHEVAHLLTAYRLRKQPLFTLPFMREGLATCIGGRAGLGPSGLLDMASYLFKLNVVTLDSMLEMMSFKEANNDPSITYAGASLFIRYLSDQFGMVRVLNIYRDLSGDFDILNALQADSIEAIIASATGVPWKEMMKTFEKKYASGEFRKSEKYPRLIPGQSGVGKDAEAKVVQSVTLKEANGMISVQATKNSLGDLRGSVLFDKLPELSSKSVLFEEQFAGRQKYSGYRYGIRFDAHEAGLYDYATSTLLAKHLNSMDPSDKYFNSSDSTVTFSFPLWISGGASPLKDAEFIAE